MARCLCLTSPPALTVSTHAPQALKCDAHITCMHAFPAKKGAAGDGFLLAFADGSFGMYNKQVTTAAAVVVCGYAEADFFFSGARGVAV